MKLDKKICCCRIDFEFKDFQIMCEAKRNKFAELREQIYMEVITKINEMHARVRSIKEGRETIGFVPTMGAIHDGHISLIRTAKSENTELIVSIYLNPTQFDNKEDLDSYPCRLDKDIEVIEKENADVIFAPGTEEMYPDGFCTSVTAGQTY